MESARKLLGETARRLLGGTLLSLAASVPLWLVVLLAAVVGLVLLVVLSPIIIAAGVALVSWLVLERMGVRGPALWLVPLFLALMLSIPFARPQAAPMGLVGTMVSWAAGGPSILVCILAAAFALLFLFSAIRVGALGALITAALGVGLGFAISAGALGTGPSAMSVSAPSGEASLPLWPVVGGLAAGLLALLLLLRGSKD